MKINDNGAREMYAAYCCGHGSRERVTALTSSMANPVCMTARKRAGEHRRVERESTTWEAETAGHTIVWRQDLIEVWLLIQQETPFPVPQHDG